MTRKVAGLSRCGALMIGAADVFHCGMTTFVASQVRAVALASECTDLVNRDSVWTALLVDGTTRASSDVRTDLANLGDSMADLLDRIRVGRDNLFMVMDQCEVAWNDFSVDPRGRRILARLQSPAYGLPGSIPEMIERAREALAYLAVEGQGEIDELRRKVEVLKAGGELPPGDLGKRMRGMIVFIGGAVLVATGLVIALAAGPAGGVAVAAAVAGLFATGGPLLHVGATAFVGD
ncbi:hypothetical protein ACFYW6_18125 [Streptomyces sp. NPDC002659]|uniref:hypothetical protein n=1 Tax=Streptomyces sp. NPDC002659 TaxID=3364656 RepID=UPI00367B4AF6